MSSSREDTTISYFSPTPWLRPETNRSSSSKSGRIPIAETAAYSWLRVEKIMELSIQQPASESLENPTSSENQANYLTRIKSSSSSVSSLSTNDSTSGAQDRAVGKTDPKRVLATNLLPSERDREEESQFGHR